MPSSRQGLLEAGADRILLKISQTENPKLKANCSRSLKNLSSDATETIEEGAVAALIAMSLEVPSLLSLPSHLSSLFLPFPSSQGKAGNKNAEDIEIPNISKIRNISFNDLKSSPEDPIASGIDSEPWKMQVELWKAEAAGRGPPAPEPPTMTTESSVDHPSTVDDLDAGDGEIARTKMAFAKMQTPFELRDSYGFDDRDFEIHEEEIAPEEQDDASEEFEEDTERFDRERSPSNGGGVLSSARSDQLEVEKMTSHDEDSYNPAAVYENEELDLAPKPKSKSKKKRGMAKTKSQEGVGAGGMAVSEAAVAELGLY
jgi:hypothetical protein